MIQTIITYLDNITIVFSFLTMIGVFLNYTRNKKQLEKIKIVFIIISTNKEIIIDKNLTRKDCQRSEIQGILRTKLKKGINYYEIDYLKNDKYFEDIYQVQVGKIDKLIIKLEDDELEQFAL